MYIIAGLLVVIIIILVVLLKCKGCLGGGGSGGQTGGRCPQAGPVCVGSGKGFSSPEGRTIAENAEYFIGCEDSRMPQGCDCDGANPAFDYAVNAFGTPGAAYVDFLSNQAIDPGVVKNHAEFIRDRMNNDFTQNITGPTYDPGYGLQEMEGADLNPWVGLRRPQNVAVCNPDQVPDYNPNTFTDKPTFTWTSST